MDRYNETKELKENILKALEKDLRLDGRHPTDVRDIEIELGVVEMAEGSARIKCGTTELIAGVKLKVETPFGDTPEEGILMVNTELTPLSNPLFESGPPSNHSIEISRVIDRGLREGQAMDVKKLCITAGEKVWVINVDIAPINYNGNLIDLGGVAALAALYDARLPKIDENGRIDYHEKTDEKLPLVEEPIPITVCKIGDKFVVDPSDEEEQVLDARITLTFRKDGNLCAVQKGGEAGLTVEEIKEAIALAKKGAEKRRKFLDAIKK
jgi:exosome complex component RRP42